MLKEISIETLQFNPFTMIGDEKMLISAGDRKKFNTMTASWGALGQIWGQRSATVYVRPQRYTREFLDACQLFTLSFFSPDCSKILELCGSKSGRDTDKVAEAGLTPYFVEGTVAFEQAVLVLVCRKLYRMPFTEDGFVVPEVAPEFYPGKDFHIMYTGAVLKVLVK